MSRTRPDYRDRRCVYCGVRAGEVHLYGCKLDKDLPQEPELPDAELARPDPYRCPGCGVNILTSKCAPDCPERKDPRDVGSATTCGSCGWIYGHAATCAAAFPTEAGAVGAEDRTAAAVQAVSAHLAVVAGEVQGFQSVTVDLVTEVRKLREAVQAFLEVEEIERPPYPLDVPLEVDREAH